jgi:hypothetical protein
LKPRRDLFLGLIAALSFPLGLSAASYYVNSSGNDADPGSLALPWKTVAPLNAATLLPGDQVYFAAGQTFTGGVVLTLADSGSAGNPVILGSYGAGRATLAPAAGQVGLNITDTEWLELQDLVIHGPSSGATGVHGIRVKDSAASDRQHFWMRNCEVSGFSGAGLYFIAGNSAGGYQNVSVTASDFHHNAQAGVDCDGFFWDQSPRQHGNFYFGGCRFYNNTKSGLILVEISGALVEYCEAHDNGPSSGCIGFWCWAADHVVFQYCESHHNTRPLATDSDGGGFDLDGATRDSILQYDYSHDNDGGGFALYQFGWAELSGPAINNIIRYNVSENDGRKGNYGGISMYGDGTFSSQPAPGDWVDYTEIYNNSIYTSAPAPAAVVFIYNYQKNIRFYNNIFYNSNVADFIYRGPGSDDGSILFKNNAYWRPGGTFKVYFNGLTYSSLAAWRGSGAGNQEREGVTPRGFNVDPLLVAPGAGGTLWPAALSSLTAYKLQATSPLRDQGVDLATRLSLAPVPGSQDFWGAAIPQESAYEIGAYELPPLASPSPTPTITDSPTASPSFSVTPTYSASPSSSETPSITVSPTVTPSFSVTPTHSVTATESPSSTVSPSFSASPTWTDTATVTLTLTPAPSLADDGPLEVHAQAPVPNPQAGPRFNFTLNLSHAAATAKLHLYSVGMTELRQASGILGSMGGTQWQSVAFDLPDLANGLYYYRLEVEDLRDQRALSRPGKLFVAR